MKYRFLIFFLLFLKMGLQPVSLSAHPHMWIKGHLQPEAGPEGLESVHVIWDIDELTSSALILDYDVDRNNVLDSKEVTALRGGAFEHLIASGYYLVVEIRNMWATPGVATQFWATIENGHIIYDFKVPLEIRVRWSDIKDVSVFLFDQTYFIDFQLDNVGQTTAIYRDSKVNFKTVCTRMNTQGWGHVTITGLGVTEVIQP